ncbi:hypothetical protein H6800_03075 [Candidatus Nomurabacteria bacterium]|nr:hypothetical protein [Candidatus Nomurabacteria bacterium]
METKKEGCVLTPRIEVAPTEWDCVRGLSDETPKDRIEVGPTEDLLAPLGAINMVSQVRQDINPDDQSELEQALIVHDADGEQRIELIQPITVGYFHRNDLSNYLDKLNSTWGTDHTVDELTPIPGSHGRYFFLVVAGHRRTLAIASAAKKLGIDVSRIDVVFHVLHGSNFTFREGIKTQYRENFHKKPESWEDAIAVSAILQEGLRSGEYQNFADCARDLAIPSERVSKAYRFFELPESIRNQVYDGTFSYSLALELHRIAVAKAFNQARERYTQDEVNEFLFRFAKGKSLISDVLSKLTDKEKDEWLDSIDYHFREISEKKKHRYKALKYVNEQTAALVSYEQMTMAQESESIILKRARDRAATVARSIIRMALSDIVSQLIAEVGRLDGGKDTLIDWSPDLIMRISQVNDGLEALSQGVHEMSVEELREKIVTAIGAGRVAISDLVDEPSETDPMGDAIVEQGLGFS